MTDLSTRLSKAVPIDRFEVTTEPVGWLCRSCGATSQGFTLTPELGPADRVARLAEAAADHGIECGRCSD